MARGNIKGVVVETQQGLFCVDPEDKLVSWQLVHRGSYGEKTVTRAIELTDEKSSALVVGAHVGTLAIPIAKSVKRLVAIEAEPKSFELLQMNLALNRCLNVEAFNFAANDKAQALQFVLNKDSSSRSHREPKVSMERDSSETFWVSAVRLDDLLGNFEFDLIVMNVEGSEYFALKGMPRLLEKASSLLIEFCPMKLRNIAGVTPEEFIGPLASTFRTLSSVEGKKTFYREEMSDALKKMAELDSYTYELVFQK